MKCTGCGTHNLSDAKFCEGCGAKLETPPPAAAEPRKRFCSACGAPTKPTARFCGACGTALGAPHPTPQPNSAQSPAPAPAAPRPAAPQPAAPAPRSVAFDTGSTPTGSAPPPPAAPSPVPRTPQPRQGGKKGCRVGCALLVVLLAALVGGGYWAWNNVVLSNPAALTGNWVIQGDDTAMGTDRFGFEPVEGGAKLVGPGAEALPFDVVVKPEGGRTFKSRVADPQDPSQWVEITVELRDFSTMRLKAQMSDGKVEEAEARRDLGAAQ